MTTSKRCSTCGTVAATCLCTGCRLLFCSAHFNDHHQQMATQLDHLMENCNHLAMRTKETTQTQRATSSLLSQIDEWQRMTIEKVSQVAENARQQALQLMRRKKIEIIEGVNSIGKEILTRQSVGDFVEYDLERLKKMINKLQQDFNQFVRSPIQLHINRSQQIDWNNLIYLEHRFPDDRTRHFQAPVSGKILFTYSLVVILSEERWRSVFLYQNLTISSYY